MGTNYDFIELYNMTGNRFFGGFPAWRRQSRIWTN